MKLKIGDRVIYSQHGQNLGPGKIVGSGSKNGMPVYDVNLDSGKEHWGYADQFKLIPKLFDDSEPPFPRINSYDEAIAILKAAKKGDTVRYWIASEKRWAIKDIGKGNHALFDFNNTYYRIAK